MMGQTFSGVNIYRGQQFVGVQLFVGSKMLGVPNRNEVYARWKSEDPTVMNINTLILVQYYKITIFI